MVLPHVDDAMRLGGVETDDRALPDLQRAQGRSSAAVRRRKVRLADLRLQPMLGKRRRHTGDEVAPIGFVIDMLKLAASAFRKVTAWRHLMVRPVDERSVVEQGVAGNPERNMPAACGDSVATCGDADDLLSHRAAQAPAGSLRRGRRRSCGARRSPPPVRAARLRRRRLRIRQARARAKRRSSLRAHRPCPPMPARPAQAGAKPNRPSGAATSVSGPLYTTTAPDRLCRLQGPLGLRAFERAEQTLEFALVRGQDGVLSP